CDSSHLTELYVNFKWGKQMSKMGKYCKAYMLPRFREFSGWTEISENARKENDSPRPLTDGDFLYLQENFVVTDGIFMDENVIFANVTPEWIAFCTNVLKFEVPNHSSTSSQKTEEAGSG
ncbi:MAG TPA: hypothetical protein VIV66_11155, partial [Pyrinomonadaceae bacterium]